MLGKGALIYVIGFGLLFSLYESKLCQLAVEASSTFNRRYMETLNHESTMNAMNIAINHVWDTGLNQGSMTVVMPPCTSAVQIDTIGLDTVRVRVCSRARVFDKQQYAQNGTTIQLLDSVFAFFAYHTPVSNYFWFVNSEPSNIYWLTGDTVEGPMHCNGSIRTSGSPVFYGKVTVRLGFSPSPTSRSNHALYYGGWEVGVDISLPTDMTHLYDVAVLGNGGADMNTKCLYNQLLTLKFQSNGTVIRTVGGGTPDTVSLAFIAPNGVIHCTQDIRVEGIVNGEVTLYSADDIWIDNDIVYLDNPRNNPNCSDFLGLVANDDVIITDNGANNNDVNINASILAGDQFGAENYSSRGVAGVLDVVGSIAQNSRGAMGTFNTYTHQITSGFSKRYHFDQRLLTTSPPHYPYVRALKLVSWWE